MRGRSACPTEQQKNFVEATAGSPLFSTRKGWVQDRPLIRPSVRTGAPSPSPRGRLCAVQPFPSAKPPPPARPAGGRAVTGVRKMGRRPVSEHRKNLPLATNQREVGPGRREPLSALVFFPPAFFQRKPGSPAVVGGGTTLQGPPCAGPEGPSNGPPPGAGRATGRCAPR